MTKMHKKILGLFGLGAVVATTVFAAGLPSPAVSAIETVKDTITVTVVGTNPNVDIAGLTNGEITTNPSQSFSVTYSDVDKVDITVTHVETGETIPYSIDAGYNAGTQQYNLMLNDASQGFGYGQYIITVKGTGIDDGDEDSLTFYYYPVTIGDVENDNGKVKIDIEYDGTNTGDEGGGTGINRIDVDIYDENGNPIDGIGTQTIYPTPGSDSTKIEIDFGGLGLRPGKYQIKVTAYDANGNIIYKTLTFQIYYNRDGSLEPIPVPDTGQFMAGLNISRTDFLITGLIVFGIIGVGGAIFIMRRDKKNLKRGNRR